MSNDKLLTQLLGDFREFRGEMNARLGSVEKCLISVDQRLDEGNKTFEDLRLNDAHRKRTLIEHEKRIVEVEKKDVLGGTSQLEKIILAVTAIGLALKSVFDFIRGG